MLYKYRWTELNWTINHTNMFQTLKVCLNCPENKFKYKNRAHIWQINIHDHSKLSWMTNILIKRFLYLFTAFDLVTSSCLILFLLSWASCFVLQNCRKCCDAVRIFTEVLGNWNFSEVWLALEHLSVFHHGDRVFCSQDESTSVFPGFKQVLSQQASLFSLINVSIPWPFMSGGLCSPNVSKVSSTWAKVKVIVAHWYFNG